jgi:hypothetical protein
MPLQWWKIDLGVCISKFAQLFNLFFSSGLPARRTKIIYFDGVEISTIVSMEKYALTMVVATFIANEVFTSRRKKSKKNAKKTKPPKPKPKTLKIDP